MGGRISAQNWYRDKRARLSGEAGHIKKSYTDLRAAKNGHDELDIGLFCRILVPHKREDCEVSICADDKPTKCYYVWQNILYSSLPKDLVGKGYPLFAPRRMIIPSQKKDDAILLGKNICLSLYVAGKEINCSCNLDKKFDSGLEIILKKTNAELPKIKFLPRLASPQNKGKLLNYFSRDFVESIEKEYSYGALKLKLPESMNNKHNI